MSDDRTPDPSGSFDGMPYAVLRRYVTGASEPAERRRVEAWAAASAARRAYLGALGRAWERGEREIADSERSAANAAWAALSPKLDVPADASPPYEAPWEQPAVKVSVRRQQPARILTGAFDLRRRRSAIPAVAAAALLAATGTYLLQQRAHPVPVAQRPAPMREVATGAGQRAEVRLGDGSTVTLGVKSRLRFPADFGAGRRELELEGAAYFVVVHDTTRPFVVHAAGSKTVDVGTAFVLRAYPADHHVQVVVTDGSVALGADRPGAAPPALLTKGRLGRLIAGGTVPVVRTVDPTAYTAWLRGQLTFDNTPLSEVAAELGRWYDVDVQLADTSLARETFTATFHADSFSEAIRTLTTVLHLRADRQGKTVVLHRRPQ